MIYSTDRSKAGVPVLVLLFVALWFILRGDLFYVLPCVFCSCVLFSPLSIVITLLGEERANLSALRTFARFVLVWICRFPLPLGVWEGLRFVIVAFPGLFSYLCFGLWCVDMSHCEHHFLSLIAKTFTCQKEMICVFSGSTNTHKVV